MKPGDTPLALQAQMQEIARVLKAEQARSQLALEALAPDSIYAIDTLTESSAKQAEMLVHYLQLRERHFNITRG